MSTSICAVLLAEACNIGLEPLIRPDVPALTRGRLSRVQQNYIRMDTLTSANARLVDAQTHIPLVRAWGGGEVASATILIFGFSLLCNLSVIQFEVRNVGKTTIYSNKLKTLMSSGVGHPNFN
ncbi:MAG: transposase [Fischerella sp. CENA71]|nr:transposase [Fischerella sp. CENA71]